MKATYVRKYRKPSPAPGVPGRWVFVYRVSGTPEEVKAYEDAQGDNLVSEDGTGAPLMFSITLGHKPVMPVIQTGGFNGSPIQFRIDTSELDNVAQLTAQYGDNPIFAQVIANKALSGLNLNFTNSTQSNLDTAGAEAGGLGAEAGADKTE